MSLSKDTRIWRYLDLAPFSLLGSSGSLTIFDVPVATVSVVCFTKVVSGVLLISVGLLFIPPLFVCSSIIVLYSKSLAKRSSLLLAFMYALYFSSSFFSSASYTLLASALNSNKFLSSSIVDPNLLAMLFINSSEALLAKISSRVTRVNL